MGPSHRSGLPAIFSLQSLYGLEGPPATCLSRGGGGGGALLGEGF